MKLVLFIKTILLVPQSTSLPAEPVAWPCRRGGIVMEDGISRWGEEAQGTVWVEQVTRKHPETHSERQICVRFKKKKKSPVIGAIRWLENCLCPGPAEMRKDEASGVIMKKKMRACLSWPSSRSTRGWLWDQIISIWYPWREKLGWHMNLIIDTLKLFFLPIWPFTKFTDNFISKKISLVFLVFIFSLITKGDDTCSLALGIYLLAHNTLFSFSAFLKTDARGDSIV